MPDTLDGRGRSRTLRLVYRLPQMPRENTADVKAVRGARIDAIEAVVLVRFGKGGVARAVCTLWGTVRLQTACELPHVVPSRNRAMERYSE